MPRGHITDAFPRRSSKRAKGDKVVIHMNNKGTTAHGFDTHAMKIDARHYSAVAPGKTMTIEKVVDTPGVFMYHCAPVP